MNNNIPDESNEDRENIEEIQNTNILIEFWEFLCENKKFWLIPILIIIFILGLIIIFGSTGAAPFIYTLF